METVTVTRDHYDALVAVIAAAREALTYGDVYRRALANELRRIAPDEPLQIDPDVTLRAGAAAGRFRAKLAALTTGGAS
jgi:hypothetical protein